MSDFELTPVQRARLRAGDYSPLDFEDKPAFDVGAAYVLKEQPPQKVIIEAERRQDVRVIEVPAMPVLFITVTSVQRHRKGFWRVRFDVTDLRDPDVFLRRGGGDSPVDELKAGAKPPGWWVDARAKAIGEFSHQERLKRFAEEQRLRGRARSAARRKRAA